MVEAFLGALCGALLSQFLFREKKKEPPPIPGTGSMKDHYVSETRFHPIVRSKEIEDEEKAR